MIELIILAAIAVFVLMRLKSVLGTRTGFEGPPRAGGTEPVAEPRRQQRDFEVIQGGADLEEDIARVADADSETGAALRRMAGA
ncbi:MAG: Tim44 domain-containing protein, partial [Pseudomonadota bacterium]